MTAEPEKSEPGKTIIPSLEAVKEYVGKKLGVSDWVQITQERIDTFADATGDHQWIHCDVERAKRESPWKQTIAHGYLTVSLAPTLLAELVAIEGWTRAVNTGIERMRLQAPVPSDSRIRMSATLKDSRDVPGGGVRIVFAVRFEVEGSRKPACVANVIYVYFP